MFNLFNKKKEENPISDMFSSLSTNQKMSVINLLLTIGICDGEKGDADKELQYLNAYAKILDIGSDKSMLYFESYGHERIIDDLKVISKSQKEVLVIAAWEMITCDGRPNEIELQFSGTIFEKIGISNEEFVAIIKKTQALIRNLSGK